MKTRKLYTAEFKVQALELMATGKPVPELARELGLSSNLLYNWRAGAQGTQAGIATARRQCMLWSRCASCALSMPCRHVLLPRGVRGA